ncbi:site-specific integrase [Rhizobium sp. TRM95796]|uniref:site-specific integrase n=1 Tax=Rhizobium sp. TRM95796 TaxID=2979862 RepID=UPI0021E7430B|nr:site-specific integrase [Rhizobium sp. TRM95796]MCV3766483.1 site-specific integrase [Rhizobium sp. TRM95796]
MARRSNLQRRDGTYYARVYIPTDLIDHFKTEDKKVSLRTKDEAAAKVRLNLELAKWDAIFDDIRSRRQITADDKAAATWQHYETVLDRDEAARRALPTEAQINAALKTAIADAEKAGLDAADPVAMLGASLEVRVLNAQKDYEAEARAVKLKTLRQHLASGETALIGDEVTGYVAGNKLLPNAADTKDIARRMMRAEIEGLERTLERDRGDYSGAPKDPIVKPAIGTARERAKPGETIMELFEVYARENPKAIATDTLNQARRDIGTFVDYVGSTFPVHRMDKKPVREWKALLMKYPVKATETKAFEGMKLAQIVKHNEKIGKPVLTPRTVNRYLSSLGAFCNWLVSHGYIDQNPTEGMSLAKEKKKTTIPFTTDQLNTLFASPLFTGCQSASEWRNIAKPGNVTIRDHRYWIPLIMLFSGARPGEIAQMAISDVRQEHGHWIMHITEEGEGDKSTKNEGSMRVVPVHRDLVKLGFLNYHAGMKKAGQARLFPLAERNARGQMIADWSREFSRYLIRLGMKTGRGLSLYSFRHGATDALRRAGFLDEQFGFILGHTKATMTGRYGILPQGMLEQRVELINAIKYPDLKIDHLF